MKTRQEMVYDFMQSLSANPAIFNDWVTSEFEMGCYGEHVNALAEELADTYLRQE
jgi:hypothetical protein